MVLSENAIIEILSTNLYDRYQPGLQKDLLQAVIAQEDHAIRQAVIKQPYDTSVLFHVFLEKSLFMSHLERSDSSAYYSNAAQRLADLYFQEHRDDFLQKRFRELVFIRDHLSLWRPEWIRAQALFIHGIAEEGDDIQKNLDCLDYARWSFQHLRDHKKEVDALWWFYYYQTKISADNTKLLAHVEEWLALSREIGYRDGELEALLAKASVLRHLEQEEAARKALNEASEISIAIGKPYTAARILHQEVEQALQAGELEEALDRARRLLKLCREISYRTLESVTLTQMAAIFHLTQEYGHAISHLEKAIHLKRELGERAELPPLLLRQARINLELGQPEEAIVKATAARREYEFLGNAEETARTLGVIGRIHYRQGNLQQAYAHQKRGLKLIESLATSSVKANLWNNLGDFQLEAHKLLQAEVAYQQALVQASPEHNGYELARAMLGLGYVALRHSNHEAARQHFEQTLALAQEKKLKALIWNCHFGLAQAGAAAGEIAAAAGHYRNTLAELEGIRRTVDRLDFNISYFSTVQQVFDDAIIFSLEAAKDTNMAFVYMEKAKARNTLDLLHKRMAHQAETEKPPGSVSTELLTTNWHNELEPPGLQNLLDDSTAVLEYRIMDQRVVVACLDKSRLEIVCLPIPRKALEGRVKDFRRILGADDRRELQKRFERNLAGLIWDTNEQCAAIYKLLIAPVAHRLKGKHMIYIVPDGILYYLPFAALKPKAAGGFLVERFDLVYAPSVAVLKTLLERNAPFSCQREMTDALLLALESPKIRFAVQEVNALQEMFFQHTPPRVSKHFSKNEVIDWLNHAQGLVHLATHAMVEDHHLLHSFLWLDDTVGANGVSGNGQAAKCLLSSTQLCMTEVLNLELSDLDLVVLSACKTALGRYSSGEGIMGLTQAFLCAGVPRLVTSLWEVEDRRTYELMLNFYEELLHNGRSPAVALRAAQITMIRKLEQEFPEYPLPYFWAPFVLTGRAD